MRLFFAAIAGVAIAGCASPGLPVLTPEFAQQMPIDQLCLGVSTFRPGNAQVARAEIARRGENCQNHAQAIQALIQQRQAAAVAASQGYQPIYIPPLQFTPIQPPPRSSVTCTSERVLNQVVTNCR